jgi:hypothetical protein
MNTEYIINSTYNGALSTFGAEENLRKFKGETEIIFNLYDVSQGEYEILDIVADFNDGSPIYKRNYKYNKKLGLESIKHAFKPSVNTYYIIYYPTLYITFSNFRKFIYQAPISIAQESFYSKYNNLDIASCQFIDNIENSLFVTFDTEHGDILNLKIK